MKHYQTIVIGGGQSGLVTGYFLKQQHVHFVILDANENIGGSWQHYYASLKLFSPAKYAELPGLNFPGDLKHYPTKAEVIAYLRAYAQVHQLPVRYGVRVKTVEKTDRGFVLYTENNDVYTANTVISATGPFNTPHIPNLSGADLFQGKTLHAYYYCVPEVYANQHVVVVGSRDSAMQIAYDLAPYARVTMAVRHPLRFMPRYFLGKSIFWWLHDTGYDEIPVGLFMKLRGTQKIVGREPYQSALDGGNPATRAMFQKITQRGVVWEDGETEAVDTIIYATGYKPGLGYLSASGALDEQGYPRHRSGVSQTVAGLYYVGLFGQRSHASATLRGVGKDARMIAGKVAQYLKREVSLPEPVPVSGD